MKNLTAALCLLFFLALPGFGQEGEKPRTKRVAILQVVDLTEAADDRINAGVKLFVRNSLASAITNTPGYEGYDRVNLSEISGEQQFQHSGAVKDDDIRKIGEATGADYVLIIEMARFDRKTFAISAKIIEVETLKMEGITPVLSGMEPKDIELAGFEIAARLLKTPGQDAASKWQKESKPRSSGAYRDSRLPFRDKVLQRRERRKDQETVSEREKKEMRERQKEMKDVSGREKKELREQQKEMKAASKRDQKELRERQKEMKADYKREKKELRKRRKGENTVSEKPEERAKETLEL